MLSHVTLIPVTFHALPSLCAGNCNDCTSAGWKSFLRLSSARVSSTDSFHATFSFPMNAKTSSGCYTIAQEHD